MAMHGKSCGGEAGDSFREIDLPVDLAALVAVFLTSTFGTSRGAVHVCLVLADVPGALFPIVAARVKRLRIPTWVFFSVKHFGTGVIIATAFIHVPNPISLCPICPLCPVHPKLLPYSHVVISFFQVPLQVSRPPASPTFSQNDIPR